MSSATLESTARDLLRRAWEQAEPNDCECTILNLVPELIELVRNAHDQPADHLAPAIRQRMLEHRSCAAHRNSPRPADTDAQVRRVVDAMEKVRLKGLEQGLWSDAPMPELMCG